MARVTVEDCIDKVDNRFDLVLLASHRARAVESIGPIGIVAWLYGNPVTGLRNVTLSSFESDAASAGEYPVADDAR